jgi:hypothetical protein
LREDRKRHHQTCPASRDWHHWHLGSRASTHAVRLRDWLWRRLCWLRHCSANALDTVSLDFQSSKHDHPWHDLWSIHQGWRRRRGRRAGLFDDARLATFSAVYPPSVAPFRFSSLLQKLQRKPSANIAMIITGPSSAYTPLRSLPIIIRAPALWSYPNSPIVRSPTLVQRAAVANSSHAAVSRSC